MNKETVTVRVTSAEAAEWRRQAAEAGLSLTAWVKLKCERQAVTFTPDADMLASMVNVSSGKRTYTPDPKSRKKP